MDNKRNPLFDQLTDFEYDKLEAAVQDNVLMSAIKKVLLEEITSQGVEGRQARNWVFAVDQGQEMTNEKFGEVVRTTAQAIITVEQAFNKFMMLLPKPEKKPEINKAI